MTAHTNDRKKRSQKVAIPKEYRTGYEPRFSALIAEMSGIQDIPTLVNVIISRKLRAHAEVK